MPVNSRGKGLRPPQTFGALLDLFDLHGVVLPAQEEIVYVQDGVGQRVGPLTSRRHSWRTSRLFSQLFGVVKEIYKTSSRPSLRWRLVMSACALNTCCQIMDPPNHYMVPRSCSSTRSTQPTENPELLACSHAASW